MRMTRFGDELVRWMTARDTGVRKLAARTGYSPGYISELRSGKKPHPSPEVAQDLDYALEAEGELAALAKAGDSHDRPVIFTAPGIPGGMLEMIISPEDMEGEDQVDRRTFGAVAAGTLSGMLIPPTPLPRQVSPTRLGGLRHTATVMWTADWTTGGPTLLKEAIRQYASARAMLDHSSYTEAAGRELAAVSSELAACAGFAAHDAGDQVLARTLLSESALLAASSEDPVASAHAYALLALQSTYLATTLRRPGPAREALRFLAQAEAAARHERSPRLHATIWMRRATASALVADDLEVRRSIANARRELDRGMHPDDPHWAAFVTSSEVTAHEAMARLSQGRPAAAAILFREVIGDPSLPARNRALYRARLARSLLAAGNKAEATDEGLKAVTALEGPVVSTRTFRELEPIAAAAGDGSEMAARYAAVATSRRGTRT